MGVIRQAVERVTQAALERRFAYVLTDAKTGAPLDLAYEEGADGVPHWTRAWTAEALADVPRFKRRDAVELADAFPGVRVVHVRELSAAA